jgi:hypothetical protein
MKEMGRMKKLLIGIVFSVVALVCIPSQKANAAYTGMDYRNGQWVYVNNGVVDNHYTGMACNEYGWWYFTDGNLDWGYTGMACNEYGWWYYQDGRLDWNYTGMACNEYGWWYYQDGRLDWGYTGMACNEYGWWYYQNGNLDWGYTGMACNENGWWYYQDGRLDWGYTGMACNENGWWYYQDGRLDWGYTGMACNENGWWYYQDGRIDWNYTGMACNDWGWWYFVNGGLATWYTGIGTNQYGEWYYENGNINFDFTGMFKDDNAGWVYVRSGQVIPDYTGIAHNEWGDIYYMRNSQIDTSYTGMAQKEFDTVWYYAKDGIVDQDYTGIGRNTYGTWYFRKGSVDTGYTGPYIDGDITYNVVNGIATAIPSTKQLMLGVFFNSRKDTTDTLYVSFDGYDFISIGEAYTNAYPEIEENNIATVSPTLLSSNDPDYSSSWEVNTLHDPSIFYRDGYFWMVGGFCSGEKYYPMMGYSTDLVNWSYPSTGKSNGKLNDGLIPDVTPLAADGTHTNSTDYDAVATDALLDDDGSVWLVVSCGYYADNHNNQLTPYLVKASGLSAPATSSELTTTAAKKVYSDFNVTYGELKQINLPGDGEDRGWSYDYDGSLFKRNGVYYFVVQHSGEVIQIWSINNLENASDKNAWTLVNKEALEGSEGPYISWYNNKNYLYTDRFDQWQFDDLWGNTYGMFASVSDSLNSSFKESVRITTRDASGNSIPARHGTVITLTDQNAIKIALERYYEAVRK